MSARQEHLRALRNRAYDDHHGLRPPGWFRLLMEARAPAEFTAGLLSLAFAKRLPRGDGQPVLVFPGLAASDTSTLLLRQFMRQLGYPGYGWAQGFNAGPRHGVLAGCRERLMEVADQHGRKVSLIGWSLGGVYAREIAKLHPDLVRQVITLGTPFAGHPKATNAYALFRMLSGHRADDPRLMEHLREPPPVPSTSIYSRSDGVVHWQCSVQRHGRRYENIEVRASHIGLGFNPITLYAVADRLAQAEGGWRPFSRAGLHGVFFGQPQAD